MRVIGTYNHDSKIGVIVEVESEFDDSATRIKLEELAQGLAMQIAATNPEAINRAIFDTASKSSYLDTEANDLMNQRYIKDPEICIRDVVQSLAKELDVNIRINRFVRYDASDT